MSPPPSKDYTRGFREGQEAVRQQPLWAPSNPYDDKTESQLFEGWEDGAWAAGIAEIYTNGKLRRDV